MKPWFESKWVLQVGQRDTQQLETVLYRNGGLVVNSVCAYRIDNSGPLDAPIVKRKDTP